MTDKHAVFPSATPRPYAGGAYSPGIIAGELIFTSGQGPIATRSPFADPRQDDRVQST